MLDYVVTVRELQPVVCRASWVCRCYQQTWAL